MAISHEYHISVHYTVHMVHLLLYMLYSTRAACRALPGTIVFFIACLMIGKGKGLQNFSYKYGSIGSYFSCTVIHLYGIRVKYNLLNLFLNASVNWIVFHTRQ